MRAYLPLRTAVTLGCFIAVRVPTLSFPISSALSHNEKPVHCASQHNFIKMSENCRPALLRNTWHLAPPQIYSFSHLFHWFLALSLSYCALFLRALSVRCATFRNRWSPLLLLLLLPFLLIRLQLPSDYTLAPVPRR